jgi:hypothetical protein
VLLAEEKAINQFEAFYQFKDKKMIILVSLSNLSLIEKVQECNRGGSVCFVALFAPWRAVCQQVLHPSPHICAIIVFSCIL